MKSIIHGMISYSINTYSWSLSLLKKIDKACKNFIWTGDAQSRNIRTISWKKICQLFINGGLRIRSLKRLNELLQNLRTVGDSSEESYLQET